MVVWGNPIKASVYEILGPACQAPTTMPHSKPLKSPFSVIPLLDSSGHLEHACVTKCFEVLPYHWLIISFFREGLAIGKPQHGSIAGVQVLNLPACSSVLPLTENIWHMPQTIEAFQNANSVDTMLNMLLCF